MEQENEGGQGDVLTKTCKLKPKKPKLFKVLLLMMTTQQWSLSLCSSKCFSKTLEEAQEIMLKVPQWCWVCGVYTHEIAESKTAKVHQISKKNGHPLDVLLNRNNANDESKT